MRPACQIIDLGRASSFGVMHPGYERQHDINRTGRPEDAANPQTPGPPVFLLHSCGSIRRQ